ncbi:MAG TPA: hypothetical protein VLR91_03130, partial [Thermodesulfobacteriota bacterium]|nr:hypothetical protein [Thermodesulfobacteriota bacterium]
MGAKRPLILTVSFLLVFAVVLFSGGMFPAIPSVYAAEEEQTANKLVETSRLTLETFMGDTANKEFQGLIKKSKAVYITPSLLKGAFVVGVSGGSGVFLVRDKKSGKWQG